MRGGLPLAAVAAVVLSTAGCAIGADAPVADDPVASATATAEVTPDPGPARGLAAVTTVVVRADSLDLASASGETVETFSYDRPALAVVDALSTVLGELPTEEPFSGTFETAPGIEYRWDGLSIIDDEPPAEASDDSGLAGPDFVVQVTAAELEGRDLPAPVAVTTDAGLTVGATLDEARKVPGALDAGWGPEVAIALGASRGDPEPGLTGPNAYAVVLLGDDVQGPADRIVAPVHYGVART